MLQTEGTMCIYIINFLPLNPGQNKLGQDLDKQSNIISLAPGCKVCDVIRLTLKRPVDR